MAGKTKSKTYSEFYYSYNSPDYESTYTVSSDNLDRAIAEMSNRLKYCRRLGYVYEYDSKSNTIYVYTSLVRYGLEEMESPHFNCQTSEKPRVLHY